MVACGKQFTMVLDEIGKVYTFGRNANGCLGIENSQSLEFSVKPLEISSLRDKKIKHIAAG